MSAPAPPPAQAQAAAVAAAAPAAGDAAAAAAKKAAETAAAGGASAMGHLSKKMQKAMTLRVDSQPTRDALKCLSEFFDENTVHTRRNLRSTIEGQNLLLHQEFVKSFEPVEKQIEQLEKMVGALDEACSRATVQLRTSKSETQASLERAAALRRESKVIEDKQEVLGRFLARFRLSEADAQLVRSSDRPLDEEFFTAFGKLEQVRANARLMLSTCGQQTSGVDILHETSEIMEASYERMFVWVQQQCRGPRTAAITKSSAAQLNTPAGAALKRVLSLLVERPVYFNHCIRDISLVRRQALAQRFLEALNQGDGTGARPIELQASDPLRYIGEMFAWIHKNAAAEQEAITVLMGSAATAGAASSQGEANRTQQPLDSSGIPTDASSTVVSFQDILNFTLEGLVTPLSNRLKQVLDTQTSIVTMYKAAQVFSFYRQTFEDALRAKENCLVTLCKDLHARTYQGFFDMWESHAQKLRQGVVGFYVSDLAAPPFVVEAVHTLMEVLAIYEKAPIPSGEREADFLPILSAAFDPLLNHCQQVAAMMDPADAHVFLINCIAAMKEPLQKHEFTAQHLAMYGAILDDQVKGLVEGQTSAALAKLGLAERLHALRQRPADVPLASVPELHPVSLAATLRTFYNSLFTMGGALALPLLERIANAAVRARARSGVAERMAAAYEELYKGIEELGVATHTPEQVRTLLG